jgi:hypothetical protein
MSQILIESNKIRTKLLIFISNELNLINKRNKLLINSKLPSNDSNNFEFTILERNIIKNNDIQYKIHNKQKNYNSVPKKYFFEEKKNNNNISKENEIFISPIKKTQKIEISKNKNLLLLTKDDLINNVNNNNNSVIYENNNNNDEKIDKEKMTQNIKILRKFCFTLKKRKLNYVSCKSMRNKSDIIRRKKYSNRKNINICSSTCVNVLKENLLKINYINSIASTEYDNTIDNDNIDMKDDKLVFHNKKKKKKSNLFNLYQNEDDHNNDFMNANNIINLMQL